MEDKKKELNETIDATKKAENTQKELKDEQLDDVSGGYRKPVIKTEQEYNRTFR